MHLHVEIDSFCPIHHIQYLLIRIVTYSAV